LSGPEDVQGHPADETGLKPDSVADTATASRPPRISLETEVQRFAESLLRQHANRVKRRPKAFKRRVLVLIALQLPPYPKPSGRPQQSRIAKAAEMYAKQQREIAEGRRDRVNWNPIANRCIVGYRRIRSVPSRQAAVRRLRDAVYRRRRSHRNAKPAVCRGKFGENGGSVSAVCFGGARFASNVMYYIRRAQ
jgi:hypothetical protein